MKESVRVWKHFCTRKSTTSIQTTETFLIYQAIHSFVRLLSSLGVYVSYVTSTFTASIHTIEQFFN